MTKELDYLKKIGRLADEEDQKTAILNPDRLSQFFEAYDLAVELFKGSGARVKYELHTPYKSMGNISVICDTLEINDPKVFSKVLCNASNIDFYPLKNEKIKMEITFHNLTAAIE